MRQCPYCSEEIPETSTACWYCGKYMRPLARRPTKDETYRKVEKITKEVRNKWILRIIAVVGLLIAAALICYGSNSSDSNRSGSSTSDSQTAASVMCEKFVRGQLKAPSTARFPPGTAKDIVNQGDSQYKVSSYVDAENSFGAKIGSVKNIV